MQSEHKLGFASALQDRAIILIILVAVLHFLHNFLFLLDFSLPDTT